MKLRLWTIFWNTTNVEVQAEVDGHSGCGDGDHINPVQDNNVVHEAEMQQDKNVCDMEYELEDDADSHHNIRVEPQTEFEETGADVGSAKVLHEAFICKLQEEIPRKESESFNVGSSSQHISTTMGESHEEDERS